MLYWSPIRVEETKLGQMMTGPNLILIEVVCELGQIMIRYDFQEVIGVIMIVL